MANPTLEEKSTEADKELPKIRCHNSGCDVMVKPDTKYKIDNKVYCFDCYFFIARIA